MSKIAERQITGDYEIRFGDGGNKLEKQHIHTDNGTIKELDIDEESTKRMQKHINYLNQKEIQKRRRLLLNKNLKGATRSALEKIINNNIDDVDASYEVLKNFINGLTAHNLKKYIVPAVLRIVKIK